MAPKFPAKLGSCIDLAYKARTARLVLQKSQETELQKLKDRELEIENHIIDNFEAQEIEKAGGSVATATVSNAPYPTLKDATAFFKYIQKTGEFDLIEKRVSKSAFRERLDAKKVIPGVEVFWKKSLSLTKR